VTAPLLSTVTVICTGVAVELFLVKSEIEIDFLFA
jgi:hypothetical protein